MNYNTTSNFTKRWLLPLGLIFTLSAFQPVIYSWDERRPSDKMADGEIPQKPSDISPLLIGETIPSLMLPDASGKMVALREKVAQKPTILIFYRGGWCPFCNKQLAGIQEIEADLRKLGYQIIAISTDSPEKLTKTAGEQHLSYTLLSDSNLEAAKQFGIAYVAPKNYEKTLLEGSNGKNVEKLLPVPAVFMLDSNGLIQFEYINPDFKQRISPDLLRSAAVALMNEKKAKSE